MSSLPTYKSDLLPSNGIAENGLEVKLGKSNPRPSTRISRHRAKRYLMFHQVQDYFDALFSVNWNIQIDFNAGITHG